MTCCGLCKELQVMTTQEVADIFTKIRDGSVATRDQNLLDAMRRLLELNAELDSYTQGSQESIKHLTREAVKRDKFIRAQKRKSKLAYRKTV